MMPACCVEVPTLQSVYDSETRDYDEDVSTPETPRDLVYEAMQAQTNDWDTYADMVHDRIWQDYRYRMLGTCDKDMFVQLLADRLDACFYDTFMACNAVTAAYEDMHIGGLITTVHGTRTDTLTRKREDLPDDFSDTYTYPTEKGEDSNVYGEQTDTVTDGRGSAEIIRAFMDALKDPLDKLMAQIADLWLNMW